jgi:molybdate transport system permease protein
MDLNPLWISLKTALLATTITFILGIAVARQMADKEFRGKSLLDGIFILPLVLPPTVVGFILLYIFGRNGIVGALFFEIGRPIVFSWSAAVISAAVVSFPLMYQTARGAFEQIDNNIEDAARTLGATEWTVFWRITMPLAWPGIAAGTILAFARSLGEFGATLMLAGNIPGKTQTIPVAIYFLVEAGKSEQAVTWVLIILAISLASIAALNYWRKHQQHQFRHTVREVAPDA